MKNIGEVVVEHVQRTKSLQYYRVVLLFSLSVSLIRYASLHAKWMKVDERVEITISGKPEDIFRSKIEKTEGEENIVEQVATKIHTEIDVKKKRESTDGSSLYYNNSNVTNNGNFVDYTNIVKIEGNESFLWQGAQSRLCTHIKKKRKKQKSQKNLHLFLVTRCGAIDERNQHGNFMLGLYAMKLAAMAFRADFTFRCTEIERKDYLLWWLQSKQIGDIAPSPSSLSSTSTSTSTSILSTTSRTEDNHYSVNYSLYDPPQPTPDVACRGMGHVALHYTSEYVRKDMRAMAKELSSSMNSKGIIVDEVAIHLRCGDIISKNISPKDKNYGLVKFQAYRKRIPSTIKSIGIVTAPFAEKNRRKQDHGSGTICQTLVLRLVDYLQTHFPNTEVRVRNDPNESIPEVVSRLILAKYNFCVRSTFCLLPTIASYGTSYVQKGGAAYFFDDVSKVYDNIHLMDEPFLFARDIRERGFNSTLLWLTES